MRRWPMVLGALLVAAAALRADDSVVGSKHDLSMFGPGPVRAVNEDRVCIFCHVPHNASPVAPLWNRHNPTAYYRIYRSDSLQARVDQPGRESKLCLSCHDGTIALGLTLDRPLTDPIPMTHMYMPSGPSDLTTDLSDDHPIGFRYDRALSNRDLQLRPPQLVDSRIKLGSRGELECTACHDAHNNELGNFLRITEREGALCTTCHEMDGWRLSSHAQSGRPVPPTVTAGEQLRYRSLADNACAACHVSHSAPRREQLLYDRPSQLCINCHDGIGGVSILPVLDQRSGHRVHLLWERQRAPERRARVDRHVECTDCHNPHAVAREYGAGPLVASQGPVVPPAMRNVAGVTLTGLPVENAAHYYEVCFRCHGDLPVQLRQRTIRQQDTLGNIRRQFVPTVASGHPVTFPSRRGAEVPSLLPALRTRNYLSCQDCHNNPNARDAGGFEVNGPHGSPFQNLLVANYDTADLSTESPQAYDLCYQCHDRNSILSDESFPLHSRHIVRGRSPCSACHDPHGVPGNSAEHSHLINFDISIVGAERFFIDQGRFRGACTLTCHGVRHVNQTYQR
jgi:predicted CXXCH cytochrome family protein